MDWEYLAVTGLLPWRVVILAVAILVSGARAQLIRLAVGGAAGHRAMAVFVALLDAAPARVREALLVGSVDRLNRPVRGRR